MFEMRVEDQLVKKPTRWMSNCPALLEALGVRCDGTHSHLPLIGGKRSYHAQFYPPKLCRVIAKALRKQLVADAQEGASILSAICQISPADARLSESIPTDGGAYMIPTEQDKSFPAEWGQEWSSVIPTISHLSGRLPQSVGLGCDVSGLSIMRTEEDNVDYHSCVDLDDLGEVGDDGESGAWEDWYAVDDVKGGGLPAHLVHKARMQELAYLKNRCAYTYASPSKAIH